LTGNDLSIYHDGTNTTIHNATGTTVFRADELHFNNAANTENKIKAVNNGQVELYYDNSKKFETTSGGVKISDAILEIADSTCLIDLMETSTTNHRIRNGSGNFYVQKLSDDKNTYTTQLLIDGGTGATELYFDGTKKFETRSGGIGVFGHYEAGDNDKIMLGDSNDLQIYHDGSNSLLANSTGRLIVHVNGNESAIDMHPNGAVELYYDNSRKLRTTSTGVAIDDYLDMDDNHKLRIGSSADLQIYHNGTNSFISNITGDIEISNTHNNSDDVWIRTTDDFGVQVNKTENSIFGYGNGAVELYYDGVKKLETTSSGINVVGSITQNGAALGGGVWERFGAVTITSNSSDVDLTWASNSSIMTDYEKIRFEFYNIKKTSDNETKIKFFDTSGNIISSGYNLYKNYSVEHNESNSFEEKNGNNDSEVRFNDQAAGENMSGSFEIYDPFDNISGDGPMMYFWKIWNTRMANATDSNDRAYFTQGAGMLANNAAWDTKICGIRMTTGTYTGGKIVAYGLKNS
jgi:hypothetical protein